MKTALRTTRWMLVLGTLAWTAGVAGAGEPEYSEAERAHWSFQPRRDVRPPALPAGTPDGAARTTVDPFILTRLHAEQLGPAPEADRRTLIRRVTYDLTGLPPAPGEVQAFLSDPRPDAYERLVERLLASPQYGEKWGQRWLDVVRFAESEGFEYDRHLPGIWQYRDYVIRSMNEDKPYDRFVVEQLAGDELDDALETQIAAGFHRLGPVRRNAGNPEVAFSRNEVLTERTDIIGSAFLGLTLGCARCHDHMFDPIRQADYYRIQAFLAATYEHNLELADDAARQAWQKETEEIEARIAALRKASTDTDDAAQKELARRVNALQRQLPEPLPAVATVRNEPQLRSTIHVLLRGDPDLPDQPVRPRFLGVLAADPIDGFDPTIAAPKQRLAEWIADRQHPLTARVIANRVWQFHFGTGLVATANDFGANGSGVSHPELLDFLANALVESGWSIKSLHRLILLSGTYRQASRHDSPRARETDPDNRWLWKFPRRRLEAHEIRDTMLAVSGALNPQMGGPSVMVDVDQELIDLLYKPSLWRVTSSAAQHQRRSIYLVAKRNLRLPFFEVFDQPDLQTSCAAREASTHAPQALELLNGRLTNRLAGALARRLRAEAGDDPQAQVRRAFHLALARTPTAAEEQLATRFLLQQPLEEFALAIFNLNEMLYIP